MHPNVQARHNHMTELFEERLRELVRSFKHMYDLTSETNTTEPSGRVWTVVKEKWRYTQDRFYSSGCTA